MIEATIDLSGMKPGKHTVPVTVTAKDERVSVKPVKSEITVIIK